MDDVHLYDWFSKALRAKRDPALELIALPEQSFLFFKGNEPAFLERAKRLAANERIPTCDGIAAIRVGAERPLQTKLLALLPACRTRLPKIPMDLTLLDQENPQIGTL